MRITTPVAALALALAAATTTVVACSGDDVATVTPPDRAPVTIFNSTLAGANERPTPVTSTGTGSAVYTLRRDTIQFTLTVSGLDSIILAHIHSGSADVAGPVVVNRFTGPATARSFSESGKRRMVSAVWPAPRASASVRPIWAISGSVSVTRGRAA